MEEATGLSDTHWAHAFLITFFFPHKGILITFLAPHPRKKESKHENYVTSPGKETGNFNPHTKQKIVMTLKKYDSKLDH